jgi:ferredoxin-nitrite reductase
MNKIEIIKREGDGFDVLPRLHEHAAAQTPVEEIAEDDLVRMKWYGVFHRQQTPGLFMMRLRTPGGRLTSAQAEAIATSARDYGSGGVDVTTRQNVQIRGLELRTIPHVWRRLGRAGMTSLQTGMDNVRNYVGCPLAGLDADEVYDTTPLIAELGRVHLGKREYSNLPRKFNVSLAGCRDDCGHAIAHDLGFVPATRKVGGRPTVGFNVLVGGALGGTSPRLARPLDVFVPPSQVSPLFVALLRVFRDYGPREQRTRARLKWLIAERGEAWLRQAVEREMRVELLHAGNDERVQAAGDHLGVHRQRQAGLYYVGLHVPVGRMSVDQMLELARLARTHGNADIRLTVSQNAIIAGVPEEHLKHLLRQPLLRELSPDPAPLWRNLVACTGIDYCHYSLIDTKNRAVELATQLEQRGVHVRDDTRIHISGCVHACGKHHVADIGIQGANVRIGGAVVEAADIYTGGSLQGEGRLAERIAEKLPMTNVADTIASLLAERVPQEVAP